MKAPGSSDQREAVDDVEVGDPGSPPADPPSTTGGGGPNQLVRVTVNLTQRAYADLQKLAGTTGLGKTDVINRALQVYALVETLLDRGNGSINVRHADGSHERIYIL